MALRRRNTKHAIRAQSSGESEGKNDSKAPVTQASPDDFSNLNITACKDDSSASREAEEAAVGAAVLGGSLLMLLALIQRASTFVLNVLLQRAMLAEEGRDEHVTDPRVSRRQTSTFEDYGAAAITLELISSTTLFLAREPFRVALARSPIPAIAARSSTGGAYRQRLVNTAWLSAPVGFVFTVMVRALVYPWLLSNDEFDRVQENRQAATLVCIAAAVELMCEPLALIFQYQLLVGVRVHAEAAAVLVLGISRYLLVTQAGMGVLSFGYAQLLHSATLAVAYVVFATRQISKVSKVSPGAIGKALSTPETRAGKHEEQQLSVVVEGDRGFSRLRDWLPGRPGKAPSATSGVRACAVQALPVGHGEARPGSQGQSDEQWVDHGMLRLAGAVAGQSVLKHVLTEGDKIVLARASTGGSTGGSLYEQGVYAIASGYGSLAARLLFQPVEEAARLMFSKLGTEESSLGRMAAPSGTGQRGGNHNNGDEGSGARGHEMPPQTSGGSVHRHHPTGDAGRRLRSRMADLLATVLKLVLVAGLVFVCFGFHYTETLLRLLLAGLGRGGGGKGSAAISKVAPVLSWYCVYVLVLAANGMCEAFACSVARGNELTGMGGGLAVSFLTFWASVGPLMSRFGTRGLVMANALGMACRVVCSAVFIRRYFLGQTVALPVSRGCVKSVDVKRIQATHAGPEYQRRPHGGGDGERPTNPPMTAAQQANVEPTQAIVPNLWRRVVTGALPHPAVLVAMAISSGAAWLTSPFRHVADVGESDQIPWDVVAAAAHVGIGAACFLVTGVLFVVLEKPFLRKLKALWGSRREARAGAGTAL